MPPPPSRRSTASMPGLAKALRSPTGLQSIPESQGPFVSSVPVRRASISKSLNVNVGPKTRTSKVSQKLVVLPSEPQTKPIPNERAPPSDLHRSESERMSKEERERSGYRRLTAYSAAEGYRPKALSAFLKREHGVTPRVFDEAIYAAYNLPLLPGYGPNVNVRSSAPSKSPRTTEMLSQMSEAEEYGYDGSYFKTRSLLSPGFSRRDGYISSSPPKHDRVARLESDTDAEHEITPTAAESSAKLPLRKEEYQRQEYIERTEDFESQVAEVVVFDYGVVVFLGLEESQERAILEDFQKADLYVRLRDEDDWEIEQCHYVYDPLVAFPRIYNDFFTFKAPSHLLTLSISHAIAQSTLLAHYESTAQTVLLAPETVNIPRQLAATGSLKLRRTEALRLTGKLFKLRRDVNLVSNVLDTPELFWSEASLKDLYDACRDYFEIGSRVQVLNDRLSVASDLLDIIHDHLNTGAMDKITWIVIWLIVVACLVEMGEVLARLFVHASSSSSLHQKCATLAAESTKVIITNGEAISAIESILDGV